MDFADDNISVGKQENTNFFEGLRKTVRVRGRTRLVCLLIVRRKRFLGSDD